MRITEARLKKAAKAAENADDHYEGDVGPGYWRSLARAVLATVEERRNIAPVQLSAQQRNAAVAAARAFSAGATQTSQMEVEAAVDAALAALQNGVEVTRETEPADCPFVRAEALLEEWEGRKAA